MSATISGRFTVTKKRFTKRQKLGGSVKEYDYEVYALTGWDRHGQRVRKQFKTQSEALTEKERLKIEAADATGAIRAVNSRLTAAQLTVAETIFGLTPDPLAAVQWYLANYRPPTNGKLLGSPDEPETAAAIFLKEQAKHVEACFLADNKRTLTDFCAAFPSRQVHEIATEDVQAWLDARGCGKKRFNNLRGELHKFFAFSLLAPRKWVKENPVTSIPAFRISRGLPETLTPEKTAELMAFVETYDGGPTRTQPAGCLAPYFALCLFAGIRPDLIKGEIAKLGARSDLERLIDSALGVIRITPEVSKVDAVRQITIQPNLAAWLARYPVKKFPIVPLGARQMVGEVRAKFGLGHDVMRHTFISMHVAKFKSMGATALEAGNSERMIRDHYFNVFTDAAALAFWGIVPKAEPVAVAA